MKKHFQIKIDDTREAYLEALERLNNGLPTNPKLIGTKYKINASTIALEAGKSRNPLYNTHKDVLELISSINKEDRLNKKEKTENAEIASLKQKIKELEEKNSKLLNINASLLYKNSITHLNLIKK